MALMPLDLTHPDVEFAIAAVRRASQLAEEVRQELAGQSLKKEDRSPVTVADFAAQALVGAILSQKFPKDVLVAEESADELKKPAGKETLKKVVEYVARVLPEADDAKVCAWIDRGAGEPAARFWVMDPIDGTKGFLRGDQYAVALALIENGEVKIGVLGCPNLKEARIPEPGGPGTMAVAVKGQGSWWTPMRGSSKFQPLHVSDTAAASESVLLRSYESGHTDSSQMQGILKNLATKRTPVLMDSLAKYTVLAAGGADLLFRLNSSGDPNRREYIWDQAPGTLIAEEAGGRATDLNGKKLDYGAGRTLKNNLGVLVSNGLLHDAALKALQGTFDQRADVKAAPKPAVKGKR